MARLNSGHMPKEEATIWTRPHTAPDPGINKETLLYNEHQVDRMMARRLAKQVCV